MARVADTTQLQEENTQLRLKVLDLEQLMSLQQSIAQQYQELSIYLMSSAHFSEFVHTLLVSAPNMLMIDHISLIFIDEKYDLRHLLADLQIPYEQTPHLTFIDTPSESIYPYDDNDFRPPHFIKKCFLAS